jgi:hypothetical protein
MFDTNFDIRRQLEHFEYEIIHPKDVKTQN